MTASAASSAPRYLLEARGVRKSFGATEVLKGVDLLVEPGSLVFLIGPSGSGKSTLLRCCNRLEEPDAGSIVMDDVDLLSPRTNINTARRQIGMVFQSFNLYPHLTALHNVTLALRKVTGKSKQDAGARAMAMLELVGLPDKAAAYPAQLSGGQQQRIAIARALALDPKIILMDEPTSALDPELVGSVLAVVKDLRARGITMVIASHEMNFAREAADKVVFLDGGLVIEQGTASEVFLQPREERTQRFLAQIRH
jgi:ABC-type polar amino acid transport system ATPase subunit